MTVFEIETLSYLLLKVGRLCHGGLDVFGGQYFNKGVLNYAVNDLNQSAAVILYL